MSNDVFESGRDRIDVTSQHRPDLDWTYTDSHGHVHCWQDPDGTSAVSHHQGVNILTMVRVHDGWKYNKDNTRFATVHCECLRCGEHIEPGYTSDVITQYIGVLRWFRINGEYVSQEEFARRRIDRSLQRADGENEWPEPA